MTATPGYVAISRRSLDLEDYIDVARRHVPWIVGPLLAGIVVSTVVAFFLPNTYVSRATMQITPAQISEALVPTTVTQQLTERLTQMENEILSRTSLGGLISDPRFNLYKSELASKPLEDVIDEMRRDVNIDIISVAATTGRRASAFRIQFSYPDKYKARDVVQAFITKFQDANLNAQRSQSTMVKVFVSNELSEAKATLDRLDEAMLKFRTQNAGKLPEQSQINITSLNSLQTQANLINDQINRAEQQRVQLEAHLQTLKTQMDTLNAMAPQNEENSPQLRTNQRLEMLNRTIADTESRLALLHESFKEDYPDIKTETRQLQVLRKERDDLQKKQDSDDAKQKAAPPSPRRSPTNVAMANSLAALQERIDATKASLQATELERQRNREKLTEISKSTGVYQQRLAETPGIDMGYQTLLRQEQNAQQRYQDLLHREQLTRQSEAMIQQKAGENLDVIDPASLPEAPSKPNRPMIVGVGTAISLVIGFAMAALQEAKDSSLKNLKDVRAYTNLPVLSSIPLLENALLVKRKRRLAYLAWSAAVLVGALAVSSSLYYHYFIAG